MTKQKQTVYQSYVIRGARAFNLWLIIASKIRSFKVMSISVDGSGLFDDPGNSYDVFFSIYKEDMKKLVEIDIEAVTGFIEDLLLDEVNYYRKKDRMDVNAKK